ncbi:uncharacterized protein LOC110437239 [Sorghum bicolor]|uniref:uncharacterized protein LOC110437239 n=1 Tax=Sorghum bicolor TaxID=4558 RepID=UPI000B423D53|nr:uncharacterized protein LOC110437239 [Sorghum bicolor]|eukprot:XP_021321293.1 uncharacterized protein LOC110437239 [Sorghum bicolor]
MVDQSLRFPEGMVKDVMARIQEHYIPTDFLVLDMQGDDEILNLLGRAFLYTAKANNYIGSGHIHFNLPAEKIGDIDRCAVYASLAPSMENPTGMDPPEGDVARCPQYTSSKEEQSRPAPTIEDRVAGKRPMAVNPSPAEALPTETSQAPKHRRLVRITDDEDEEEEAAPSLVRRPRSRPDVAPITIGRVTSDPPTPHAEPTLLGGTEAAAATSRTRRRFFAATVDTS